MRRPALALFVAFFCAYLLDLPPYLAPYRDAGEMATAAATLGVAHPPSYPLYVLLGKLSQALPFGSPAYRLSLLSALAASGAVALLFLALETPLGALPAAAAAIWLGGNRTFWSVAVVPEMYGLSALQAAALLGIALRLRRAYDPRLWRAFAFLYGLSLGNRTDLLLLAPGLAWLGFCSLEWRRVERSPATWLAASALWAALGLSIYLYLPLRSAAGPWLDWNHPASPANLIGSLTRRSYGGTLDLLSKSYPAGAMFGENLKVYLRHLRADYLGWAFWLPALGAAAWWRRDRAAAVGLLLAYAAAGPLFLFLANLPPNPHALAIVEPHYLLSDLLLAVLAAGALRAVWEDAAWPRPAKLGACGALLALSLIHRWGMGQRWNLYGYDYARNVLLSTPRDATLVAKKDVQLFTLWYAQRVEGLRPDVRLVAEGLAGSGWYQQSRRRFPDGVQLSPLRDAADWSRFVALNGQVFATPDCEIPPGVPLGPSRGLVVALSTAAPASEAPWALVARRGEYRYDAPPDFFRSDLIEAYALARLRLGSWLVERGRESEAARPLRLAWAMKWLLPEAPVFLGFAAFRAGRLAEAATFYGTAASLFERTLELAAEYRALPEVFAGARRGLADALLNEGVAYEKQGRQDEAEASYRKAIERDPNSPQAHFNLAVLYWGRDWNLVASEMAAVLQADPRRQDAARYLAVARQHLVRR